MVDPPSPLPFGCDGSQPFTQIVPMDELSTADGFEQPSPVGELDGGDVASPVLSPDGTTIGFASSRPGGAGGFDIWQATRSRPDDAFGEPTNVGAGDWDMWIALRE